MDDASRKNRDGSEELAAGGDVLPGTNSSSKPEMVEKYISQMHDLLFMLENDLSMPQKRDPLTTLPKDYGPFPSVVFSVVFHTFLVP